MARIVVAEDDPDIHELVGLILESAGHDVRLTSSGTQALAACLEDPPDIALLDVSMPGELDGLAVARRLREEAATHDLRIVLLTAHARGEAEREGLAAGADDYVVKPFDADDLLDRVAALLAAGRSAGPG